MNAIERILAKKAGKETVSPGEDIVVQVDLAMAHDVTGPIAIEQFLKTGAQEVYHKDKVVFVVDHNTPCSTVQARIQQKTLQSFCEKYGTRLYNRSEGVIHQVAFEKNMYEYGDIVVGADSHTCTAGASGAVAIPVGSTELAAVMALGELDLEVPETHLIEIQGSLNPGVYGKDIILHIIGKFGTHGFTDKGVILAGDTIQKITHDDKMTMANMMIEMGAMIGYIQQGNEEIGEVRETHKINAKDIVPCAACPSSPGNVKSLKEVEGIIINQAVIGSCTNGRYADMEIAANVLKGRRIAEHVNLVIFPASSSIMEKMEEEGLTRILRNAGAIITNPGCGPCFGAHQGLLTEGDVAISSTNRNFPGRMGHKNAHVYLASPRAVAESAIAGKIVCPGTVCSLEGDQGCGK